VYQHGIHSRLRSKLLSSRPTALWAAAAVLALALVGWCLSLSAHADISTPTLTTVYFEQNGQPYNKPVRFTVKCYGYSMWPPDFEIKEPGTYTPKLVYSFHATCPHYGCQIDEPYYLNYRHIDRCDLEGETAERQFTIANYDSTPVADCVFTDDQDLPRVCAMRFDIETLTKLPVSVKLPAETKGTLLSGLSYEHWFVAALLITLIVEVPVVWALSAYALKLEASDVRIALTALLASVLTLPYLWFIAPATLDAHYAVYVGEVLVILVEAILYKVLLRTSLRSALLLSLIANCLSFVAGLLLF
jgi:hypothetical protein